MDRDRACLLFLLPALLALLGLSACGDDDGPTGPAGKVRVFIISPPFEEISTAVNDTLTLVATVSDDTAVLPGETVHWASDRDGELGSSVANDGGQAILPDVLLSPGTHEITATVLRYGVPAAGDAATIHHVLPARVHIVAAEASIDGVALRFTSNREDRFDHYDVRRWVDAQSIEQSERVTVTTARNDTTLVDPLPPLAATVHYAVVVVDEADLMAASPTRSLAEPNGPILPFLPWDVAAHPELPLVYVLDRASPASRLVALDYEQLQLVADRSLDHGFCQYLDVAAADQGGAIYLSRSDDGISVLHPLTLAETTHVPMGHGTASVAVGSSGEVFVSLGTGSFSIPPVRAYHRSSWDLLATGGHYDWSHLEAIPGTGDLLEITMGLSPAALAHYHWDPAGQTLTWTYIDRPAGSYIDQKIFRVDPSGRYAVTHQWGSVYAADAAGTHLGNLGGGATVFRDFAFSADGSVIHAGVSDQRHARSFAYPSLAPATGVSLRGYPWRMVRVGDLLISLSRPEPDAERVGLDVVRVGEGAF